MRERVAVPAWAAVSEGAAQPRRSRLKPWPVIWFNLSGRARSEVNIGSAASNE